MKACFATDGFHGKIDCHEWAKDTKYKSLPMKYRGKKKMQQGGTMPRQQDYPDYESWAAAMDAWHQSQQGAPLLRTSDISYLRGLGKPEDIGLPSEPQQSVDPMQQMLSKGIIEAPRDYSSAQDYYTALQQSSSNKPKPSNPYQTLQNAGLGIKAAGNLLGEIAGRVERNRQNQFDYTQQTALGQMNPMPLQDFQPNPYNLYMMKGGKLKTIIDDFNMWSNNAGPMDMTAGTGNPELKKGGYEIDRMLVVRKVLPELLKLGRMGGSKYRNYQTGGGLPPTLPSKFIPVYPGPEGSRIVDTAYTPKGDYWHDYEAGVRVTYPGDSLTENQMFAARRQYDSDKHSQSSASPAIGYRIFKNLPLQAGTFEGKPAYYQPSAQDSAKIHDWVPGFFKSIQEQFMDNSSLPAPPGQAEAIPKNMILPSHSESRSILSPRLKKGGNWIPKDLKKGRCTPAPNPDCPVGSPQYNLAMTFKKHHGFHKKK